MKVSEVLYLKATQSSGTGSEVDLKPEPPPTLLTLADIPEVPEGSTDGFQTDVAGDEAEQDP